ncbi:hypothetical protein KM915_10290 [Cytobacillus oceanisediminis]|uniref:hypothetical protein n=1 Tax=Cytobacillus oceanisediminis TaxID=665099 RepID=UPI001C236BB9|nr:hypothetical protein [Cytobacillus oceanisediminis]MBU8730442.1 hypothetical protein [Cytobacillus oceanisediminis]
MKSLWPSSFDEQNSQTPQEILEQQAKFLPKITEDMVVAVLEEVEEDFFDKMIEGLKGDFFYQFLLKSKFLPNYHFRVMTFSHEITIYPIYIRFEDEIKKELALQARTLVINNEEEFIQLIEKLFNSERMKKVIGAMIKLAKS